MNYVVVIPLWLAILKAIIKAAWLVVYSLSYAALHLAWWIIKYTYLALEWISDHTLRPVARYICNRWIYPYIPVKVRIYTVRLKQAIRVLLNR